MSDEAILRLLRRARARELIQAFSVHNAGGATRIWLMADGNVHQWPSGEGKSVVAFLTKIGCSWAEAEYRNCLDELEMDELLDEVDAVFVEDAEKFIRPYIQKPGK